jgi:hypothetical protein
MYVLSHLLFGAKWNKLNQCDYEILVAFFREHY